MYRNEFMYNLLEGVARAYGWVEFQVHMLVLEYQEMREFYYWQYVWYGGSSHPLPPGISPPFGPRFQPFPLPPGFPPLPR